MTALILLATRLAIIGAIVYALWAFWRKVTGKSPRNAPGKRFNLTGRDISDAEYKEEKPK